MASPTSRTPSGLQPSSTQGSTNQGYPRRYQADLGDDENVLSPRLPRRYSTLSGNIDEQRQELRLKLDQKENGREPLPVVTRADQCESYLKSPWARKIVLCLGMFI
jgi:hypothetical protein